MRSRGDTEKWIFGGLWVVFFVLGEWASHELLPLGHWGGTIATQVLAPLLASAVGTLYLRASGRSLEARPKVTWLNARRLMIEAPPIPARAIKPTPIARLALTLGSTILVAALLLGFRMPLIAATAGAVVASACWWLGSATRMMLGAGGVCGALGASVAWEEIYSCQVQTRRSAWGRVSAPRVSVLGRDGRALAVYRLDLSGREEQRDFLLALHRALQPGEAEPQDQVEQVLAGIPGPI